MFDVCLQVSSLVAMFNIFLLGQSTAIARTLNYKTFSSLDTPFIADLNTIRPRKLNYEILPNATTVPPSSCFSRTHWETKLPACISAVTNVLEWYKNTSSERLQDSFKRSFLKRTKRQTSNNCIVGYVVKRIQNTFLRTKMDVEQTWLISQFLEPTWRYLSLLTAITRLQFLILLLFLHNKLNTEDV